jgi:hypothetical protein
MIRKILGAVLAAGVACAAVSTATDASAGSQWSGARLTKNADGSGNLYGTFAGFRNNADANAYIDFSNFISANGNVYASLNGVNMSCAVPSSLVSAFNQALLSRDYISVSWNAAGTCTVISVSNSSEYGSY